MVGESREADMGSGGPHTSQTCGASGSLGKSGQATALAVVAARRVSDWRSKHHMEDDADFVFAFENFENQEAIT